MIVNINNIIYLNKINNYINHSSSSYLSELKNINK